VVRVVATQDIPLARRVRMKSDVRAVEPQILLVDPRPPNHAKDVRGEARPGLVDLKSTTSCDSTRLLAQYVAVLVDPP